MVHHNIPGALAHIKSELDRVLPDAAVDDAARALGHRWRERVLTPCVTVHLFLLQLLARVALAGLRHAAGVAVTAQAVCKAKQRLPLDLLLRLVEHAAAGGNANGNGGNGGNGDSGDFRGHRVVLADATCFLVPDTDQLARRYGKGANQHGMSKSGYPLPKLLALLDRATGAIRKVIAMPHARQERMCLHRLFKYLSRGDVLLADRGLVSMAHLALVLARGLHAVARLPEWLVTRGRGKATHRRVGRLGKQDLLVQWRRRAASYRPAWMSRRAWALVPEAITLRQVAFRIRRKGHRDRWAYVVTTLLDPRKYPAKAVAELYGQRWRVEVCFRDMKQALGLARVRSAKTVAGVRKEVACLVLLYNLVRQVIGRAAAAQAVAADRVSFADALAWLRWAAPGAALPALAVNPARPRRPAQPRAVKRGRDDYPRLKAQRASLCTPAATVEI